MIVSEGHKPKKWFQLHLPMVKKHKVLCKVPHVNFFRWENVPTPVTMLQMVTVTNIYVVIALDWGSVPPTRKKTVEMQRKIKM